MLRIADKHRTGADPVSLSLPCRTGVCRSPVEVTAGQMAAAKVVPEPLIKVLLYPGAAFHALVGDRNSPGWNTILGDYNMTQFDAPSKAYMNRIEVDAQIPPRVTHSSA